MHSDFRYFLKILLGFFADFMGNWFQFLVIVYYNRYYNWRKYVSFISIFLSSTMANGQPF